MHQKQPPANIAVSRVGDDGEVPVSDNSIIIVVSIGIPLIIMVLESPY
jgi:hypothetical protein